jgi:hypothetical protein
MPSLREQRDPDKRVRLIFPYTMLGKVYRAMRRVPSRVYSVLYENIIVSWSLRPTSDCMGRRL